MDKYVELRELNKLCGWLSHEDIHVLECILKGETKYELSKLSNEQINRLRTWYKINFYRSGRWNKKRITEYLKTTKTRKQPIADTHKSLFPSNATNDLFIKYCADYTLFPKRTKPKLTTNDIEKLIRTFAELKAQKTIENSYDEISIFISKGIVFNRSLSKSTIRNKLIEYVEKMREG